ncbi:MAG: putative toxin-antitoxin system toxin component, PIN family [Gammaproteobacteria bacterium RIFCSPHIGHO2_12_FULL_37_34]|nr:MAG: putative toxin-antitoxin system toxin component, PIN family [Gammaproteobacteria bacterium RIFCSPHIGHO2_12_FULL_37_34]
MRIILDTNVFISGIFWSGPPYEILKAWQTRKIKLILSQEILIEYNKVSKALSEQYPAIRLLDFIELLAIHTEIHLPIKLTSKISRDPHDDKFIACALSANVNIIVSGDKDLLCISGYHGIEVIKPSLFVKQFL